MGRACGEEEGEEEHKARFDEDANENGMVAFAAAGAVGAAVVTAAVVQMQRQGDDGYI